MDHKTSIDYECCIYVGVQSTLTSLSIQSMGALQLQSHAMDEGRAERERETERQNA